MTTADRPPTAAHRAARARRVGREQLTGVGALTGLLGLLVAVPFGLGRLLGSPLPAGLPTLDQVRALLTAPLDDQALIRLLAAAAWLAWLHLAGSILLETGRQLHERQLSRAAGRPIPTAQPTGGLAALSVNRRLAQRLVTAALVLLPATAAALLPTANAVPLSRAVATQTWNAAPQPPAQPAADRAGTPYGAILDGSAEPAAVPSRPPVQIDRADDAAAPSGQPTAGAPLQRYVVAPPHGRQYDSLWAIAARHLGDGRRYHEIYHLNRGRPQPDGQTLTRASLIRPGWELLLPADATGAGLRPARIGPAAPADPVTAAPRLEPAPPGAHPADPAGQVIAPADRPAAVFGSRPAAPAPAAPADGTRTATSAPSRTPAPAAAPPAAGSPEQRLPLAIPLGLGIGALGVLAALQRARRIAQRRRPAGARPAPVPVALARVEAGLRREAKAAAGVADTVRLGCALAGAAAAGQTTGDRLSIRSVLAHDGGGVDLLLDPAIDNSWAGRPPAPFLPIPGGWQLPVSAAGYTFAAADLPDPLPALLPVGRADDAEHFHDLRPDGLVALTGADTEIASFLTTAAAALAGAPWAGQLRVLAPPPLAADVGRLEHLEPVADLPAVVPHVLAVSAPGAPGGQPYPPAEDTRQLLVLIGWRAGELPPLLTAAALDPQRPVIALVHGPHPDAAATWTVTGRQLTRPGQPATSLTGRTAAATAVPALLDQARSAPPVPADDEQYRQVRLQAPPRLPPAGTDAHAVDEHHDDARTVDEHRDDARDVDEHSGGPDDVVAVPAATPADDSPDPAATAPIRIRILGPVDICGAPAPRRTPVLQTLIYLAVHRRGVDAGQLATALWPEAAAAGQTLRNRVREARSVVGGHITAGPRWQLDERIGCDWQHFQALAAGDDNQQRAALELVRGRPFQEMADTEWIHLEGLVTEIEAAIVDVALAVADRALANNEPAAAFAAARAGLRASPYEERLYRLAMRAADAEGATGKIRTVMRELRTVLDTDIEPDDTIETETVDLYQQLMDSHPRTGTTGSAGRD